jgi:hypothetical protein
MVVAGAMTTRSEVSPVYVAKVAMVAHEPTPSTECSIVTMLFVNPENAVT